MNLNEIKIEDCEFSVRVLNGVLKNSDYRTLADLHLATNDELRRIRNIGARSIYEIREMIASYKPPPVDNSDVIKWTTKHPSLVRAMIQLEREIYQLIAEEMVRRDDR